MSRNKIFEIWTKSNSEINTYSNLLLLFMVLFFVAKATLYLGLSLTDSLTGATAPVGAIDHNSVNFQARRYKFCMVVYNHSPDFFCQKTKWPPKFPKFCLVVNNDPQQFFFANNKMVTKN